MVKCRKYKALWFVRCIKKEGVQNGRQGQKETEVMEHKSTGGFCALLYFYLIVSFAICQAICACTLKYFKNMKYCIENVCDYVIFILIQRGWGQKIENYTPDEESGVALMAKCCEPKKETKKPKKATKKPKN